ncbi:uncharacterized protein LOC133316990 [Gastrolobium bilobum]|uniref:uncharacterized protein LOC133316990 n=1 Tax=Gastrolobium bilobum TaxID=150636 RepID=UPI002AB1443A|nr:uncharacterized protein LOC133316990 [Gastrolobium bilobum]
MDANRQVDMDTNRQAYQAMLDSNRINNEHMMRILMEELRAGMNVNQPPHAPMPQPQPQPQSQPQPLSPCQVMYAEGGAGAGVVHLNVEARHHDENVWMQIDDDERRLIAFKKHKPPCFCGTRDPIVAANWLQAIEKIFRGCLVQGDANEWWFNTTQPLELQGHVITWHMFEGLFLEKYFPQDARERKQGEFERLVKGPKSIDDYLAKFNELVKFANYRGVMPSSELLAAKFQRGLNEKIAELMACNGSRDFATLVNQCKKVVDVCNLSKKSSDGKESDSKVSTSRNQCGKTRAKERIYKSSNLVMNSRNLGIPRMEISNIFRSVPSATGHYIRDCPKLGGRATAMQAIPFHASPLQVIPNQTIPNSVDQILIVQAPTFTGRVYTLDPQQSERAPNLVKGTNFIDGIDMSVLFATGATHSFVSSFVAIGLNMPLYDFKPPMVVKTATGEKVSSSMLCKDVEFVYDVSIWMS